MDSCLPISEDIAMTFTAESITLCEVNQFPVVKPKFISISCVMAIEAPSHGLGMVEFDLSMFFF
jgi:hypothetical protein